MRAKILVLMVLSISQWALLGHSDDPKARMQLPVYRGTGYKADLAARGDTPNFPQSNVTLLSWITVLELDPDADSVNDCWGYTSPGGREYAIVGTNNGTAFVDISDPGNARLITLMDSPNSLWRDVKTYGSFAYVVSEGGGGIQVFDLSNIDNDVVVLSNSAFDNGTDATHNVAIDEVSGFLYRTGGSSNGLRIFSLADPGNPVFVGQWERRYSHDVQVVTYQEGTYAGRQIAFTCGGFNGGRLQSGLTILDVTDKANIVELAHLQYPFNSYAHQGWLSADRKRFYLNDELDEETFDLETRTRVINVEDLAQPFLEGIISTGLRAIDHNLYIKGNLMFQSNYLSGLRIFAVEKDSSEACEVAFFDTYPESDNAAFSGLWSNFPFFESGIIIGSDMQRGLFVWRIDPLTLGEVVLPTTMLEFPGWANRWLSASSFCREGDANSDGKRDVRDLVVALNAIKP